MALHLSTWRMYLLWLELLGRLLRLGLLESRKLQIFHMHKILRMGRPIYFWKSFKLCLQPKHRFYFICNWWSIILQKKLLELASTSIQLVKPKIITYWYSLTWVLLLVIRSYTLNQHNSLHKLIVNVWFQELLLSHKLLRQFILHLNALDTILLHLSVEWIPQ